MLDPQRLEQSVLILGGGQAGGRAAESLRLAGHKGPIVIVGEEAHPPYERPSLSKEFLHEPNLAQISWVRPRSWYEESNVTLVLGNRATKIDRNANRVNLEDGTSLNYEVLVIATGTRPSLLCIKGADHPLVTYLRTVDDSLKLRQQLQCDAHIVVIGAGFIGLEVAATALKLGCEVTVVEVASLPLGRAVPPAIGRFYAQFHKSKGVNLQLGTRVERIIDRSGKAVVELSDGRLVPADAIVVGIGVTPNVEIAAKAGLKTENGIVVNEYGQTSDPSIFAAGDVTNHFNPLLGHAIRLESWQNAQNQAIAVARNVMGAARPYAEVPWFWSDQFDLNLQVAGCPKLDDEIIQRGVMGQGPSAMFHLRDEKLVAVIGINCPRDVRFAKDIISMGGKISRSDLAEPSVNLMDVARAMKLSR